LNKIKFAIVLAAVLFLCSCNYSPLAGSGANQLLSAPILNQKQAEINEALAATLYLPNIVYRYPQQGDNRTPFIFYDLDGDNTDEAIVFFSNTARPSEIRVKVLKQDENGRWYSFSDIPGHGDQIDFISFASIISSEKVSVMIGWQDTARRESQLEILSIDNNGFNRDILHKYSAFSVADYGGNDLSQIVIVTRESRSSPFEVKLLGGAGGKVQQVDSLWLFSDVQSILQMKQGRLWDGSIGVFVDELSDNETVSTEIVRVSPNALSLVAGAQNGKESPEWNYYLETFRPDRVLCEDINNDDIIEVPYNINMPGTDETDESETALALTVYRRPTAEGFVVTATAAVNTADGYRIFYPNEWIEHVTVISYPENRQWRFFRQDEKSLEPTTELLRITLYQTHDYDEQALEDSIFLDSRGAMQYYGYIPPASYGDEFSVTPEYLQAGMFKLI